MTHQELCERAVRWLWGSRNCNVALSGIASTSEIPDAIGWSTSAPLRGSIVIECKTSVSDFKADAKKKHRTRMGDYRYFLTEPDLVSADTVKDLFPDHGLAYVTPRGVREALSPPRRESANLHAEIRLLEFALVHAKDNLLRAGFSVDMSELTKHWMSADCGFLKESRQ